MKKNILILGATSAIAEKLAQRYAKRGCNLFLVARDRERLQFIADDLVVRGAVGVFTEVIDLGKTDSHSGIVGKAERELGGMDLVLIAYGTLGDQKECQSDYTKTLAELNNNCLSVISLLTHIANLFENKGKGCIAVISSVAGDRGRQSNYIYGTAKGALTIYLQGLRNRLAVKGVHVLTVKPGFVDTPMTRGIRKGLLWVSPDRIAKDIDRAINKKKDVVYTPFFWRYIMLIIRMIPEKIFKKLSL